VTQIKSEKDEKDEMKKDLDRNLVPTRGLRMRLVGRRPLFSSRLDLGPILLALLGECF
jgi:hypothetical protein